MREAPSALPPAPAGKRGQWGRNPLRPGPSWLLVAAGAAGLLAGLALLLSLRLETDLGKLDGTPQAVLDEEQRALAIWGGGESLAAILCVEATDLQEALLMNDQLYAGLLAAGLDATTISSLSPLCPAAATRRQRRQQWSAFWTMERLDHLRRTVEQEAAALDFSAQAFQPFWDMFAVWADQARETEAIGFLNPLYDSFVHVQDGITRVTTFVPDLPDTLAAANRLRTSIPSLRVVSRNAFSAALSGTISREIARLSLLAAILVLAVVGLLIRRLGMIVLALIPAVAGMVWGGAGMALLGLPLNISNLIAGIIVFGLCIDYGISMVYAQRHGIRSEVLRAVTLSAATTVLGAAVLLLARHPAFFSIGVTLVAGVAVGYLYAWLALLALQTVWPRGNPPALAPPLAGPRQATGPSSPSQEETA